MKQRVSWGIMFLLSIVLLVAGFQGSLGKILACFFIPSEVIVNQGVE